MRSHSTATSPSFEVSDVRQQLERGTPGSCTVFVPEVHAIGMIAVVRSLARAGHRVWAGAADESALGLRTASTSFKVVHPAYESADFLPWLRNFVAAQQIDKIVPSEAFLLAIDTCYEEFAGLLPLQPARQAAHLAFSKARVTRHFIQADEQGVSRALPESLVVERGGAPFGPESLRGYAFPVFVKADAIDSVSDSSGVVRSFDTAEDACRGVAQLLQDYSLVLVQSFVSGKGVGVYFLLDEDRVLAEYMNLCIHEVPHTGGFCSYRRTWFNSAIRDDALLKARSLGWRGVIMLEYRWDSRSGEFWFVEVNARFWAALHLALFAGVDFPRMMLHRELGGPADAHTGPIEDIRCRITYPYEVSYVWSKMKDREVTLLQKLWAILEFFLLMLDPRIRNDLWFPGDRRLYVVSFRRFLSSTARSLWVRIKQSKEPGVRRP